MNAGAFGRRGAGALAAVAAASLAAAGFLGAFGDALWDPPSAGADAFSRSAVGHRALVELLRGAGHPVLVSRHRTAERTGDGAVVALLEPRLGPQDPAREELLEHLNGAAPLLLVVLPKRLAIPDPARPGWVTAAPLLPAADAQRVLDALGLEAKVARPGRAGAWRGPLPAPVLEEPQLVVSEALTPLVESADGHGVLAGELLVDGWRTVVLADPDVLASHGLARGENAALALALFRRLGAEGAPVVVDETLHGHELRPSLAGELLRFPLVLATASALLAAALLAWAALVRFGRPERPAPALPPGGLLLVETTAELLRQGGAAGHAAAAYLRAAKDEVARRLRHPGEGERAEAWLARTAAARGKADALLALEERVRRLAGRRGGEEEAVRTARDVHRWREEMTDGAHDDPGHDRAAQG